MKKKRNITNKDTVALDPGCSKALHIIKESEWVWTQSSAEARLFHNNHLVFPKPTDTRQGLQG